MFRATPILSGVIVSLFVPALWAGSTEFTFQGYLEEGGVPAEGPYDFKFSLFSALGVQIGTDIFVEVEVGGHKPGVFQVELDFGYPANADYLRIEARPDDTGSYQFVGNANLRSTLFAMTSLTLTDGAVPPPSSTSGTARTWMQIGTGNLWEFAISNPISSASALTCESNGIGVTFRARATGSGTGIRAEGTSGLGLDVAGTSAFSGTAAFTNAAAPFTVPVGSAQIPNLNASFLGGTPLSSFALLAGTQTYSGVKTLNGRWTISTSGVPAALNATNAGIGPALSATNSGAGLAADFSGDVDVTGDVAMTGTVAVTGDAHVSGAISRDYSGTSRLATPLAYGFVSSTGVVSGHTLNVTVMQAGMDYRITIAGENYVTGSYVTTVTPDHPGGVPVPVAVTTANGGQLVVRLFGGGAQTTGAFQFITFKSQ